MTSMAPEAGRGPQSDWGAATPSGAAGPFVVAPRLPLPEDAQAELADIMHGEEAQAFFRDYGEDKYQAYIETRLRRAASPDLKQFIGHSAVRQRRNDQVAPPTRPSTRARPPAQLALASAPAIPLTARLADPGPPTLPRMPRAARPAAQQPSAPTPMPPARAPDLQAFYARQQALDDVTDRYARLVAEQRLSHGAALLANEQGINPSLRLIRRLGATALDPFALRDYRRADALAGRADEARRQYLDALTAYVDAAKADPHEQVRLRVGVMDNFERQVSRHMLDLADPAVSPSQHWVGRRHPGLRRWLTDRWAESSRLGRAAMIAVPMLGAGAVAGVVVGWASPPPELLLGAWYMVTAAGSSFGAAVARVVNRLQVVRTDAYQTLEREALELNRQFANRFVALWQPDHTTIDVTEAYQARTFAISAGNLHRLRLAQTAGAAAAALGFGLADASMMSLRSSIYAPHPPARETPTPQPTPPLPHVTTFDTYPWNVAHQLDPARPMATIQHAADAYNAQFGTHLQLVPHSNGTVWLQDGATPLNRAQQASFNTYMYDHFTGVK